MFFFVDDINKSLPGLMELDFQGFYSAGLFVGTKEKGFGALKVKIDEECLKYLAMLANGDARNTLNLLELSAD